MTMELVVYDATAQVVISEYEARHSGTSEFWKDSSVVPIRKVIKQHYIPEQRHLCCYCRLPDSSLHGLDWDVEHIVAQSAHPRWMFLPENLAVACRECNSAKGAKEVLVDPTVAIYPTQSAGFHVVHPHFDDWRHHIIRDHLTYAARTPKGSWTIRECKLNRSVERDVGLRYPLSDSRYESLVRALLDEGKTLQDIASDLPDEI